MGRKLIWQLAINRYHPSVRKSIVYVSCALAVLLLGLASRRYGTYLPPFLAEYAGDTLWALIVFLGFSAVSPNVRLSRRGGAAFTFAVAIEVSQLYHAPWIDGLRDTPIGGLVLGFGFLWTDLLCYATGIAIGILIDWAVRGRARIDSASVAKR